MKFRSSNYFKKRFRKLPQKIQDKFWERLYLYKKNSNDIILRVHPLKGTLAGHRSFSVTGDYRAIFRYTDKDTIKFIDIGTHGQLYGK